ncbi:sulfur oxidation c-type cytochrome SoxX [[Empedobacter] haloabium]|uniref:Sulfur oxidation c-type cytochrome SoxX n=1 Tax=[Empedobacter] haloabium TaxID=592317 RepID=A0ABZ1UJT0_9BURK
MHAEELTEGTDPATAVARKGWQALARGLSPVLLACAVLPPAQGQTDTLPNPLPNTTPGDPTRGRAIVANRQLGTCLLCHTAPISEEPFQGNLAPNLAGTGSRWTVPQLRLRVADPARINPGTIMPSYHRGSGLARVAPAQQGKPLLSAQQIEDVVAYLATLRNPS